MRVLFILVLFLAAFILIVMNLTSGVDLTPDTSGIAQAAAPTDASIISESQVITIQDSPATTSQTSALVSANGGCTNPYTIQSGDSLYQIAVNCNTTLAVIRQANPQIINANLIYLGQQVNIPNGNIVQIPVTGKEEATPVASGVLTCACPSAPIPVTGLSPMLKSGSSLQVRAINFPPNTSLNVAIGPKNTAYTVVTSAATDADGNLTTSIIVPAVTFSQTLWVVVVSTTSDPSIQAMSRTFNIDP